MKKFFAFMLVLAMIASMMCINVAAENIVGTHKGPNNGSISDGVNAGFQSNHQGSEITAKVDLSAFIRYAVDLEYTAKSITLYNDADWDVNNLKYVGTVSYSIGENAEKTPLTNGQVPASIGDFTIINYSNADVYVTANAAVGTNSSITTEVKEVAVNGTANEAAKVISNGGYSTVPAVYVERVENTGGTAQNCSYSVYMSSTNWLGALWNYESDTTITIATITFTVTSSAPQQ